MIFDNMMLPDNTLPLDNIMSAQNATNLQNMMNAQSSRMTPQTTTTTLQDMLAQQNAALAQNNGTLSGTTPTQNARTMQNSAVQNSMASPNMMPARSMNAVAAMQSNRNGVNKAQATQQLAQSCFAVHEAVLYLDTHPDDQNALEYYRRKQQQLMQASENYQKVVGPIRACTVDTSSGGWRWIETPWPWEIEED